MVAWRVPLHVKGNYAIPLNFAHITRPHHRLDGRLVSQ